MSRVGSKDLTIVTKRTLSRNIVFFELLGLAAVLVVIWANEWLDLPHVLFGVEATPANWLECVVETTAVSVLAIGMILQSQRAIARVRYLEGILNMCSYCKRIRMNEEWVGVDHYVMEHSEALVSHGLCPECLQKHYAELAGGESE